MNRNQMPILSLVVFSVLNLCSVLKTAAQTCPCSLAFHVVKTKTALNYAGFSEKVTDATRTDYEAHTQAFEQRADTVQSVKACAFFCQDWLNWFKDRHLQVMPDMMRQGRRPDSDFALTALDSQTLLFKLPSMGASYKGLIDSILSQKKPLLETHSNLIIDCRGNAGGAMNAWHGLKPYLYTGPVLTDGILYWASEDNAKFMLATIKPGMPKAQKRYYRKIASEMKKKPGAFVGTMNARREQLKAILPNPAKVVILVNNRSASSTEAFVLWAQQSKKVTIMGEQTAGVADYGSNCSLSVPCHNWLFSYPIARSNRVADGRGIDNVGIAPNVLLNEQTGDWVEFARVWLRGK